MGIKYKSMKGSTVSYLSPFNFSFETDWEQLFNKITSPVLQLTYTKNHTTPTIYLQLGPAAADVGELYVRV